MNYNLKSILFWLLILLISPFAEAQKGYALQGLPDLILGGAGLASGTSGWLLGKKVKPLQSAEIALLNRNDVFAIDRKTISWRSKKAKRSSDILLFSSTLAPVLLLTDPQVRKETGVISVLYLETLTLNGGLTLLTKNLTKRPRPFTYNPDYPWLSKQVPDARKSFFSGHTSSTAASCFFAAKVWSDVHPGNKWKPAVWAVSAGIPAFTGLLRMHAGQHFLTDVLVGYVVGAATGWLVPHLHRLEP